MDTYIVLCIQVTFLATLQAQAPGDGSPTCQNAPFTKPPYPSNIVPLMDSYDYLELTVAMGGPWNTLDVDGDTRTVSALTVVRYFIGHCRRDNVSAASDFYSTHVSS